MNVNLPPRPPSPHSYPLHHPRAICRKFVYTGICKEVSCPRAHVPHNDMLDLLHYLMQRRDFPPELRTAKGYLRHPTFVCRRPLPSDRICDCFFPLHCTRRVCNRTHFSVDSIYRSLLWVDRSQSREGSKVFLATPVDPTTRPVVPILANNEQPVVKLPQSSGPGPFNHDPPLDVVVQLPKVSPPDSETTPTESVDS